MIQYYAGGTQAGNLAGVIAGSSHVFCEDKTVRQIRRAKLNYEQGGAQSNLSIQADFFNKELLNYPFYSANLCVSGSPWQNFCRIIGRRDRKNKVISRKINDILPIPL